MAIVRLNRSGSSYLGKATKPPFQVVADKDNPLMRSLVHCFMFNEQGGTSVMDYARDKLANGFFADTWVDLPSGWSQHNGLDAAAVGDFLSTTNLTLEVWHQATATPALGCFAVIGTKNSNGYQLQFSNGANASGTIVALRLPTVTNNAFSSGSYTYDTTSLHQYILTRDTTNWTLYVDGVSTCTGTANPVTPVSAGFFSEIGNSGLIRIWNRVISAAEIQETFRNPYGMFIAAPRSKFYSIPVVGSLFRPAYLDGLSAGGRFSANPIG